MKHEKYRNAAGVVVPSVTTIIGRFKDSGGLIQWAYKCGCDGVDINQARMKAADAGTAAHDMIDADVHGQKFDPAPYDREVLAKAEHAFIGYLDWKKQTNLQVVASEIGLVSERHQFGGRFDAAMIGGGLTLADYKSGSGIYTDALIQVAGGYSLLWQEHFPEKELSGIHILRISKPESPDDPVSFHHHHWSAEVFTPCQRQFILFREAYELDKRLKGLL